MTAELIYKKDAIHAVLHNTGDAAVAAVQNIKAVDTVTHGKWLPAYFDNKPLFYYCSKCELRVMEPDGINYCPNCGAKMDGEHDGLITMEQAVEDCLKSLGIRKDGESDERTD